LSVAAAIAWFRSLAVLACGLAIAGGAHRAEVARVQSLLGHRHHVYMPMLRMLVTDPEPLNLPAKILLEPRHDLLGPSLQIELARGILMLWVRGEHQPVDVVVRVDAIDARVGT
jgi:hypothetical protein